MSRGLCAVALLGVWNWRGTNEQGGKTALADFEQVALNDRDVYLCFDSDVVVKRAVHQALARLAELLRTRGAKVQFVYLPEGENGKLGVDDYLAGGGTVEDLRRLAEASLRPAPAPQRPPAPPTSTLLEAVEKLLRRFVHFGGEHEPRALALYALHTWAIGAAHATPYIYICSPEKRSGKTRLLEALELACHNPMRAASITEAALFQAVEKWCPSLLIDEVDAIFTTKSERAEALRGVLNAGNQPGSYVVRGSQDGTPVKFATYCPKVLAGINTGKLPDTIRDRSIVVRLERKLRRDTVDRLRARALSDELKGLHGQLADWADEHDKALSAYKIDGQLAGVDDRLEEAWEPLLAIADLAGGDWPARARTAAAELAKGAEEAADQEHSHLLLDALRDIFANHTIMTTKDICTELNEDDDLPFGAYRRGEGIDGRGLSKLLKPYRILRRTVRVGAGTAKGYHRSSFEQAWARYTHSESPSAEGSQGSQGSHPSPHRNGDVTDVTDVTDVGDEGNGWNDDDLQLLIDSEMGTA